jgi:hypothetical protein
LAGLALPVGLALAVYFSSAGAISATPVSLPVSAERIAQPSPSTKWLESIRRVNEPGEGSHAGATRTGDDGGGTSTEDRSGSDANSGPSGSSGSGSSRSDSSGPGSGSSGSSGSSDSSGPGSGEDD